MENVKKESEITYLRGLLRKIVEIQSEVITNTKLKNEQYEEEVEPVLERLSELHFNILHHRYIPLRLNENVEETLKDFGD